MGNCGSALYKRNTTYEVEYYVSGVGILKSWKGEGWVVMSICEGGYNDPSSISFCI